MPSEYPLTRSSPRSARPPARVQTRSARTSHVLAPPPRNGGSRDPSDVRGSAAPRQSPPPVVTPRRDAPAPAAQAAASRRHSPESSPAACGSPSSCPLHSVRESRTHSQSARGDRRPRPPRASRSACSDHRSRSRNHSPRVRPAMPSRGCYCRVAGRDLTRAEWHDLLPTRSHRHSARTSVPTAPSVGVRLPARCVWRGYPGSS